jgi:hypothetical protein
VRRSSACRASASHSPPQRSAEFSPNGWPAITGISQEHLLLLYPPGPDGTTPKELAGRIRADPDTVKRQSEDLADLGYLELEAPGDLEEAAGSWGGPEPRRAPQGLASGVT